jgi:hypothetical protein
VRGIVKQRAAGKDGENVGGKIGKNFKKKKNKKKDQAGKRLSSRLGNALRPNYCGKLQGLAASFYLLICPAAEKRPPPCISEVGSAFQAVQAARPAFPVAFRGSSAGNSLIQ